uniref:Uncharacterized protein n=1 Tax=Metallosphaera hakonensis JCM 8857 = DSM 7519 TaxID=1293036 RepID=A0A2U9ITI2_9CREN
MDSEFFSRGWEGVHSPPCTSRFLEKFDEGVEGDELLAWSDVAEDDTVEQVPRVVQYRVVEEEENLVPELPHQLYPGLPYLEALLDLPPWGYQL